MSGTARITVSPSSVRMRRSVVCVAGCCGPKFRVHRYSPSAPSGGAMASTNSRGMDTLPCNHQAATTKDTKSTKRRRVFIFLVFFVSFVVAAWWFLTFRSRQDREVVALAAAAHRIVLAQREGCELVRHQDAAQVGVAVEDDAIHVVDFTLHPVGAAPQRVDRGQFRVRVINKRLHDQ